MKKNIFIILLCITFLSGCVNLKKVDKLEVNTVEIPKNFNSIDKSIIKQETNIINFWKQFNDDNLLYLIEETQKNSPNIAEAVFNLKKYETNLELNKTKLKPYFEFETNYSKKINPNNNGQLNVNLQTSWEVDLFNKNNILVQQSKVEIEKSNALLYDIKTYISSEVARNYFDFYFCQLSLKVLEENYESQLNQSKITASNIKAGFEAKSAIFATEASLADFQKNIIEKKSDCNIIVKNLVSITGLKEEDLNVKLKSKTPIYLENDNFSLFVPINIPGELIEQRPDIFISKQQLEIDYMSIMLNKLKLYPTISISGSISKSLNSINDFDLNNNNVKIGPLSIYLPIINIELIKKEEELSIQKYKQSQIKFKSNIKTAIKEVEVSLINLETIKKKNALDKIIIEGYKKSYEAALDRYKVGLSSLYEVEDYKKSYLNSVNSSLNNKKLNFHAWIDLYKAVGGGFTNNVFSVNDK